MTDELERLLVESQALDLDRPPWRICWSSDGLTVQLIGQFELQVLLALS